MSNRSFLPLKSIGTLKYQDEAGAERASGRHEKVPETQAGQIKTSPEQRSITVSYINWLR